MKGFGFDKGLLWGLTALPGVLLLGMLVHPQTAPPQPFTLGSAFELHYKQTQIVNRFRKGDRVADSFEARWAPAQVSAQRGNELLPKLPPLPRPEMSSVSGEVPAGLEIFLRSILGTPQAQPKSPCVCRPILEPAS